MERIGCARKGMRRTHTPPSSARAYISPRIHTSKIENLVDSPRGSNCGAAAQINSIVYQSYCPQASYYPFLSKFFLGFN